MKRRRLLLAVLVLALVTLAGGLTYWLTAPKSDIYYEDFESVVEGMTREEVIEALGVPPGDHGSGLVTQTKVVRVTASPGVDLAPSPETVAEQWMGEEFGLVVIFKEGKVASKVMYSLQRTDIPLSAKIRRWLRL